MTDSSIHFDLKYSFKTKEEAEHLVRTMKDLIDVYGFITVADMHDLIGRPSTHVDTGYGWTKLDEAAVNDVNTTQRNRDESKEVVLTILTFPPPSKLEH